MLKGRGFTLVELMAVIVVVAILAAVAIPLLQGRIDKSKWSEACATAGTVRRATRAYAAETSVGTAQGLTGNDLGDASTQSALGFSAADLEGTYFTAADYTITAVNGSAFATITVTGGSKAHSPTGTYVLEADGGWVKQ
ncbi:MAG: prepilin-type N-terminal cleavage/methylation domain-containing protein [Phycisphaerales bacterium]|nr:MAG: prepilin-type N-terminal cleavage/methylation domain-containing protein [Phycisphaerales bacterium]